MFLAVALACSIEPFWHCIFVDEDDDEDDDDDKTAVRLSVFAVWQFLSIRSANQPKCQAGVIISHHLPCHYWFY